MLTLSVSINCGMSYFPDCTAETIEELQPRMDELDAQNLRWILEDADGQPVAICDIHKRLFVQIAAIRQAHDPDRAEQRLVDAPVTYEVKT